jgi:hypothetical protein
MGKILQKWPKINENWSKNELTKSVPHLLVGEVAGGPCVHHPVEDVHQGVVLESIL